MNNFKLLKPEAVKKAALAKVAEFKKEQEKGRVLGKRKPGAKEAKPIVEEPEKKLSPEEQKELNWALWQAAKEGKKSEVERLLGAGANANNTIHIMSSPLQVAAYSGHREIVELMLAKGADVNDKGSGGDTALMGAAHGGHKEIAELLIAKGAELNARGLYDKKTALDWAADMHHKEVFVLLKKHGAKLGSELE